MPQVDEAFNSWKSIQESTCMVAANRYRHRIITFQTENGGAHPYLWGGLVTITHDLPNREESGVLFQ